jgi:steroid delta-isomerase-like uncharacterized protein
MSSAENRRLLERFYEEVMSGGNLAFIDEYCSADYVDHDDDLPAPGREGLKQHVEMIRRGFPDTQVTVEDIVAEGDKVAVRTTARGTHMGEFMGVPPTGKQITISGMDITRFSEGKIVEHWGLVDAMAMMQQLGLAAPSR